MGQPIRPCKRCGSTERTKDMQCIPCSTARNRETRRLTGRWWIGYDCTGCVGPWELRGVDGESYANLGYPEEQELAVVPGCPCCGGPMRAVRYQPFRGKDREFVRCMREAGCKPTVLVELRDLEVA